jgi:polyhydroxybutyrate depolymerase
VLAACAVVGGGFLVGAGPARAGGLPLPIPILGSPSPSPTPSPQPSPTPSAPAGPTAAPGGAAGTDRTVTVTVGRRTRSFTVFVPNRLPPGPRPLVLLLHSLGASAAQMEKVTGFDLLAARAGVYLVYPTGVQHSWDADGCCGHAAHGGVDDVAFLSRVIDWMRAHHRIDPRRVAVGGFSNGALMAYRLLCADARQVDAVFAASGVLVEAGCRQSRPVPLLGINGLGDRLVPWKGTRHSRYPEDHVFPPVLATADIFARLAGCARGWTQRHLPGDILRFTGRRCRVPVIFVRPARLGHFWTTAAGARRFGIDETTYTWSWLAEVFRGW